VSDIVNESACEIAGCIIGLAANRVCLRGTKNWPSFGGLLSLSSAHRKSHTTSGLSHPTPQPPVLPFSPTGTITTGVVW
jgi:hypothetical protein